MDEQLKQRLVGAVVLVSLGVVFIPMLLRPSPDGPAGPDAAAPGAGSRPSFNSRVIPVGESDEAADATEPPSVRATPTAPEPPAVQSAPPRPVEPRPPTPEAPPAPRPLPPPEAPAASQPADPKSGFVVQLGSFANERNADALSARLIAKGYRAFVKTVSSSRGTVTRVYVGPSATRASAATAVDALERETSLRGMVVRYP